MTDGSDYFSHRFRQRTLGRSKSEASVFPSHLVSDVLFTPTTNTYPPPEAQVWITALNMREISERAEAKTIAATLAVTLVQLVINTNVRIDISLVLLV